MMMKWAAALTVIWSFSVSAGVGDLFALSGHNAELGYSYTKLIKYDGGHNPDVLYYLYAETGAPDDLVSPTTLIGRIRREWSARQMDAPTVVAIGIDPLAPDLKRFLHEIMFDIQSTLPHVPRRNMLLGLAQGADNALKLSIKASQRFSKIALIETSEIEGPMVRALKIRVRRDLDLSGAEFYFDEVGRGQLLTTLHKTKCALALGKSVRTKTGVARLARFFL